MKTVVVYNHVTERGNAIGSCLIDLVRDLPSINFVVFTARAGRPLDIPSNMTVNVVKVPASPLVLLYILFPLACYLDRRRLPLRNLPSISCDAIFPARFYWMHFSHRTYLRRSAAPLGVLLNVREMARLLDHFVRAIFETSMLKRARGVFAPTARLLTELGLTATRNSTVVSVVVPNRVASARQWPAYTAGPNSSRSNLVLIAGGAFGRKGVYAAIHLLVGVQDVRLRILGGTRADILSAQRYAERLSVAHRVEFLGTVKEPANYVKEFGTALFLSTYEVASLALLEALGSGRCIIATDVGNARVTLLDVSGGFIVPVEDEESLILAVKAAVTIGALSAEVVIQDDSDDVLRSRAVISALLISADV